MDKYGSVMLIQCNIHNHVHVMPLVKECLHGEDKASLYRWIIDK